MEKSLCNVKQLVMEIHSPETWHRIPIPTVETYLEMYNLLAKLEMQGFRKYKVHLNVLCSKKLSRASRQRTKTCYDISFININFLTSN